MIFGVTMSTDTPRQAPPSHSSNAFDIFRHVAAISVLFSHHFALSNLPEPKAFGVTKLGTFAVIVFFSISGYLITNSYLRSSSIKSYFEKRIFRIFPALIICSIIMTFIICANFGKTPPYDYILSINSLKNFFYFSLFGAHAHPDQMNFFASNYKYPDSLNGSLWTLFFEFFDYLMIVVFINNKKRPLVGLCALLFGSISIQSLISIGLPSNYYIDRATILTIPFALGGILLTTKNKWYGKKVSLYIILAAIIGIALSAKSDERSILFFSSVPFLVIILGSYLKDRVINGRFDFSYGIYIYAFPTQQLVINNFNLSFWVSMIISATLVFLMSILSWYFVEKRFIKRKKIVTSLPEIA